MTSLWALETSWFVSVLLCTNVGAHWFALTADGRARIAPCPAVCACQVALAATALTDDGESARKPIPVSKNQPNRCASCSIRVGFYGFSCKCGNMFCAKHRYSDLHDCSFDYSQAAINQLKKVNPKVIAQKMVDYI